MYTELDIGVGRVVQALQAKGMWDETLFVFVSLQRSDSVARHFSVRARTTSHMHSFIDSGQRRTSGSCH